MRRALLLALCGGPLAAACAGPVVTRSKGEIPSAVLGLRVRVASEVTIVGEGDVAASYDQTLRNAVEMELGRAGLPVVARPEDRHDLLVRVDTRVRGAVYFLHGRVSLTAEHDGVTVAMVTAGPDLARDTEFPIVMARRAVQALLRAPAVDAFAQRRTTSPAARPPPGPQAQAPASPSPPDARPSAETVAAARKHAQQGTTYYNLGRFKEALAEYETAYLAVADPALLFNIAQCHRKMGNDKEALAFYRTYLRNAPDAPNRDEIKKRIQELEGERGDGSRRKRP